MDKKYLTLLSKKYPTMANVASEIINLNAIKSLPKGTEYFFSDLHGEHEAFLHLLRSASGMIKTKIDLVFGKTLTMDARDELADLIYYPDQYIKRLQSDGKLTDEWRRISIYQLIQICSAVSSKYARSRVRKRMPEEFQYIFDELLNVTDDINKDFYFNEIIRSIIETEIADSFICALCKLIGKLAIDQLHIIGDIFDRGPRADIILNELIKFGEIDIQWGNHDVSWMGAAVGNKTLMANVIRISMAYNNFDLLEDGYGINLRPLSEFADKTYKDDPCEQFMPHMLDDNKYDPIGVRLVAKMHKAITIIQLKLEGQLINRHPEYGMDSRDLLSRINIENMNVEIEGSIYSLLDNNFPTIDSENPLELTEKEAELVEVISASFKHSHLLQKHIKFIYSHGAMYKKYNENLMYHGCIPMNEDGSFQEVDINGTKYRGKSLLDKINEIVIQAYYSKDEQIRQDAQDFMWYLWCGPKSPVFGKDKMATFEKYFLSDKQLRNENYNMYYKLSAEEEVCNKIMDEFGVDKEYGHIINGHVPVKIKDGESPIKAGGKLFIIDGGISKSYQSKTGIAGYTLIYDSHALRLAEHTPFVKGGKNTPKVEIVKSLDKRKKIADTDKGKELSEQIADLQQLLEAYKSGDIKNS